jgi:hypothetical protein
VTIHQAGADFAGIQCCHLCGTVLRELEDPLANPFVSVALGRRHQEEMFFQPGILVTDTPDGLMPVAWSGEALGEMCSGDRTPRFVGWWLG